MWRHLVEPAAGIDHPQQLPTVRLSGELDLFTLPGLRARLSDVVDVQAPTVVIVDLAEVTFMDCSALGPLLAAHARLGGRLELKRVPPPVARVLELTGLSGTLLGHRPRDQTAPDNWPPGDPDLPRRGARP